jgi:nitric oxide reductase activation protein
VRPRRIAWMLSLLFLFAIPGNAQRQTPPPRVDGTAAPADADDVQRQIARDMAKKANEERQAALKADTDKLVKLAGELKDYVDKTNENVLSLDVVRKAEEIEKLAHSVKDKMKGPN